MIQTVDTRMRTWIGRVAPSAAVSLAAPSHEGETPRLSLYLLTLHSVSQDRTLPYRTFDLELDYLVTAWADDTNKEHELLGQVLLEASQEDDLTIDLEAPRDTLWTALGIAPRPCFRLRTMARHDFPALPVRRVETVEWQAGSLRTLRGLLVDPKDRPVVGARVELRGSRAPVRTGGLGEFSLRVLAESDRPLALKIRAKGLEQRWTVAADQWPERFVFSFENPEV